MMAYWHWIQIEDVQNLLKSFRIIHCFNWEGDKDFISLYFCFDHLILGVISLEDKVSLLS